MSTSSTVRATVSYEWTKNGHFFSSERTIHDTPAVGDVTYRVDVTRDGCDCDHAEVTMNEASISIDTEWDFKLAELILHEGRVPLPAERT